MPDGDITKTRISPHIRGPTPDLRSALDIANLQLFPGHQPKPSPRPPPSPPVTSRASHPQQHSQHAPDHQSHWGMLTNNTCPQAPPLEILGWGPGTSIFIKYPQASLQLDKLKDYPGAVLEFYFVSSKITWVLITKQIPTPLTPRKSLLQKPWGRTLRIRNLINTEGF